MTTATAPMTPDEARPYLVLTGHRSEMPEFAGEEGYASMGAAKRNGWATRASWGLKGWDLGSWPLVAYFFRVNGGPGNVTYELAEYIEGDVKVWHFPTDEMRSALVDHLAFWWWANEGEDWTAGHSVDDIPDHLRGPFTWERLNESEHRGGQHVEFVRGCASCDLIARSGEPPR